MNIVYLTLNVICSRFPLQLLWMFILFREYDLFKRKKYILYTNVRIVVSTVVHVPLFILIEGLIVLRPLFKKYA